MPRGSKASYTDKQKRKAAHIAEGYEKRGVSKKTATARAWATVNAIHGGGEKSGSGRGKPENTEVYRKGQKAATAARKRRTSTAKTRKASTRSRKTTARKKSR